MTPDVILRATQRSLVSLGSRCPPSYPPNGGGRHTSPSLCATSCWDNPPMSSPKVLFGFHAVGVRLKTAPQSIIEIYFEPTRRDARMRQFLERAKEAGVRLIEADGLRLAKLAGSHGHQGVAARVNALPQAH